MKLTEMQNRIMSQVHLLRENDNLQNKTDKDVTKMIESIRFKNLEDMPYGDLYTLESYIKKTNNEVFSSTVYYLISEVATFVESRLLDENSDVERVKLSELKKFLGELDEELRDWELRKMQEDMKVARPLEADLENVVDSLSSIIDRLIVQYGDPKKEQKELEEMLSHVTPKDSSRDIGEQPKQGEEGERKIPAISDEGDGDLKEADKDFGEQPTEGDKEKNKERKMPKIDLKTGKLKEVDKDFGEQPTEGDKAKSKKRPMPKINQKTGLKERSSFIRSLEDIEDLVKNIIKKKGSEEEVPADVKDAEKSAEKEE